MYKQKSKTIVAQEMLKCLKDFYDKKEYEEYDNSDKLLFFFSW